MPGAVRVKEGGIYAVRSLALIPLCRTHVRRGREVLRSDAQGQPKLQVSPHSTLQSNEQSVSQQFNPDCVVQEAAADSGRSSADERRCQPADGGRFRENGRLRGPSLSLSRVHLSTTVYGLRYSRGTEHEEEVPGHCEHSRDAAVAQ